MLKIRNKLYAFSRLGNLFPLAQSYMTLGEFNSSISANCSYVKSEEAIIDLIFLAVDILLIIAF